MKKQLMVMGLVVGALMAAMLPGVATAKKDKPKDTCKKGGWEQLVDVDGQPFTSQADCIGYANGGGIPVPPEPAIFAIAYTNLDGAPGFGAGDVLIAKWVDDNENGAPDAGDLIVMGTYPTTLTPSGASDLGTFGVTTHTVGRVDPGHVQSHQMLDAEDGQSSYRFRSFPDQDSYEEDGPSDSGKGAFVYIRDGLLASRPANQVLTTLDAPSQPSARLSLTENPDDGDSALIDVDISY